MVAKKKAREQSVKSEESEHISFSGKPAEAKADLDEVFGKDEDIYTAFGITKGATLEEIKRAYKKLALRHHPDKLSPEACDEEKLAKTRGFQRLALYYSILSDDDKRARYDRTGSVKDAGSSVFHDYQGSSKDLDAYFADLYGGFVDALKIEEFAKGYKGSEEEKEDIVRAYDDAKGDMGLILETVLLSSVEEESRLKSVIDALIADKTLKPTAAYRRSTSGAAVKRRVKQANKEAEEAEELRKKLGLDERLRKIGKTRGGEGEDAEEDSLKQLILSKKKTQEQRFDAMMASIEAKYGGVDKKATAGKGKRKQSENADADDEAVPNKQKTRGSKKSRQ
ncbi:hypothetical protein HDU93_003965 [Gonapodya sp. JEL0774]|nr:hypothetical protein HDU93_003965 [Gonapodya sp. JEL0774]